MTRSTVFLFMFLLFIGLMRTPTARSAEGSVCNARIRAMVKAAQDTCANVAPGQVCSSRGKIQSLKDVTTLQTAVPTETENQLDSMIFKLPSSDEPITLALYGGATLTSHSDGNPVRVVTTLSATNKSGYNANLRAGPNTTFKVTGSFNWDANGLVDGRSGDGKWLHLTTEGASGWIATGLVQLKGDAQTLPILSGEEGNPMQKFTLKTSITTDKSSACGDGTSGLLIAHSTNEDVHLHINGADLTFGKATLLLQAQANDELTIHVITGRAAVSAGNQSISANTDSLMIIPLGGDDGLQVGGTPQVKLSYPFSTLVGMPLGLVTDKAIACTAGIMEGVTVTSYIQPDTQSVSVGSLAADAHYGVTGWAKDSQGGLWWKLDKAWVLQSAVQVVGECSYVREISPNASVSSSNQAAAFRTDFVPPAQSVWSAETGTDQLSGNCVLPQLPVCSHPVALIPSGNTLTWRGQEPTPYIMTLTGDNTYLFTGRNHLDTGKITMKLNFTSPTNWKMSMSQVFDADAACVHTLYYDAVPR
jgi:hypothetical protein